MTVLNRHFQYKKGPMKTLVCFLIITLARVCPGNFRWYCQYNFWANVFYFLTLILTEVDTWMVSSLYLTCKYAIMCRI